MALLLPIRALPTISLSRSPTLSTPPKQCRLILSDHPNSSSRRIVIVSSSTTQHETSAIPPSEEPQPRPSDGDRTRLIAQNIPWTSTAADMRELFAKHGTVTDVELSMHSSTKNRGLAFITMASEEEALAALTSLDSYELEGRVIKVEFARSAKRSPSSNMTSTPVKKYTVFVGNLDYKVRSRNLKELFSKANKDLLSAEVVFQSNPRRSAGYGFVTYSSMEEVEAAIATFDGQKLMGRSIRVVLGNRETVNSEGGTIETGEHKEASTESNND
ncbi:hypothetical protein QJS04_geneDACA011924 [Acorus gramineus]|uniref:RRM domain-containing protein n=1 Tax=Acorus gramineus TaxID=55184 RepID=A0AAV9AHJ3_ACOGR|nr:hypothetical protein QJS04_geneDACA011924 [Acorus gramineus]